MAPPVRFILYVVRTSPDPDHCDGSVPWRVDDRELFFGPCKKALRRALRRDFLGPERTFADVTKRERIVVAGVNAGHGHLPRKIVFAGELAAVMSFAEADARLRGPRYERMRANRLSPLHIEPLEPAPAPTGYRRVSDEHAEATKHAGEFSWWDDLVPRRMRPKRIGEATTTTLRLKQGVEWWDGFPLDACFTLSNRFWAAGAGLALDDEFVRLLTIAQHKASQVSASAPFGRDRLGAAVGLRGSYLELGGRDAEKLLAWLDAHAPVNNLQPQGEPTSRPPPSRRC